MAIWLVRVLRREHLERACGMVCVRLSDPMFNGDVYAYLAGTLPADVKEEGNVLTVDVTGQSLATADQIEAVKAITLAWQAAGHYDVRAEVRAA